MLSGRNGDTIATARYLDEIHARKPLSLSLSFPFILIFLFPKTSRLASRLVIFDEIVLSYNVFPDSNLDSICTVHVCSLLLLCLRVVLVRTQD